MDGSSLVLPCWTWIQTHCDAENHRWKSAECLCQAVFWGSCLCTKLRYVLCHRGPLQGRISFQDQSLKCNVLLPPFQYLSITLSSASSTSPFERRCAGPWDGVVWPNHWQRRASMWFIWRMGNRLNSNGISSFPISSPYSMTTPQRPYHYFI